MNNIVACIDGSRASPSVCDHAAWVSRCMDLPVVLLHVSTQPETSGTRPPPQEQAQQQGRQLSQKQGQTLLNEASDRLMRQGILEPGNLLRQGDIAQMLQELQHEARIVVVGRQGNHSKGDMQQVGRHLETIIRTLGTPVLIVPEHYATPQRFLIAYDGSEAANKVVARVAQSRLLSGLSGHLLMVSKDNADNRAMIHAAQSILERKGFTMRAEVRTGPVEESLTAYQEDHDIQLTVMGPLGHSRVRQFFVGSTTTRMLKRSRTPLLILR
ncbi:MULTISPECIES: universal stress protein [unclassified Ectothiorhodospira]|uniref:universal stress protein n=1 Tax=unclassified Ectothiorhodospira TaxID=2684909 RepID=UPI001EE7DCCE|nr:MULTISPECIES: universal stress protein [unclassified Ectothiorhodospira]MCG5515565.1 universal stress protein [Ectothiorhodospira sp. 9100]MCG5518724.1 universal stress protein [Ectothiorhodospira sp. 9905]